MSTLSSNVALTTGGVTRLVDRMAEAGLVARENCPSDRRSIHVVLTPEGRAVLERAIAQHVDSIDRHLMAHLDAGRSRRPRGRADEGARRRLLIRSGLLQPHPHGLCQQLVLELEQRALALARTD